MIEQVPTTVFVGPVPEFKGDLQTWFAQVAGFCQGAQSVKKNGNIRSLRFGNMVFLEGTVEINGESTLNLLPVNPRQDGFLQVVETGTSEIKAVVFSQSSKEIDVSGLADGTYLIKGSYIADIKRES